jgi:hypothetical protein
MPPVFGSHTTHPLPSTLTKVSSNLSQGFVERIELHDAASMRGNAVEKSVLAVHKVRPFNITPFNLIANERREGRLHHGLVNNVPLDVQMVF